ncbi:NADH-quinone oxidoreductase subunit L [Saccharospirillum impatiens]|jgi:NAD(P)H-quinone oxidoreductase subunit 5|uniref:NADH-quinone oxidoreductase subunit L n=1 Tax=Saccharospirillum impatiens TaxID=169438 RepID=UPI0003FD7C91|nr:NADH-quinone oxidoreductase subunit L [Saccharospirillum impatiens]
MWLTSILLISIPVGLAAGGWWAGIAPVKNVGHVLLRLAFLLVSVFMAAVISNLTLPAADGMAHYISVSNLSLIMMGLIVFMSVILIAFSRNYMAGEQRVGTYWRWLLNTLAAVSLVIISNHLVVFWLGWVSISLSLHKLLTFYPDRPRATLAAHKKFLLARTAESLLLVAVVLLYQQHGTLLISELMFHFNQVASNAALELSTADQIAAVLIAMTALIKCAQLPVHGWLVQVVEAPTPVSALLHAGVINLGGFLLILFAPLFMQVAAAQWLVLIVAGFTTVVSALVMTTRISLKVRMAWSTSAQMGLMLLECALGLYELALLHLLTHSAYKAYSFLNAGNAVNDSIRRRLAPSGVPSVSTWLLAMGASSIMVVGAVYLSGYEGVWSIWLLLALALTMLIAQRHGGTFKSSIWPFVGLALLLVASYSVFKSALGVLLPIDQSLRVSALSLADIWAMLLFITLFALSWFLRFQADSPAMQRLSMILFAGLYLDEWLTRLTLKIWPVRLPAHANPKTLNTFKKPLTKEL